MEAVKKMERNKVMWIVIGLLFLAVLFSTFKVANAGGISTGGAIDMTGWTENEKMNYEMHGTIPARASGGVSSAPAGSGMVGGC